MFRIEFDPQLGAFVIEVLRMGFIWKRVRTTDGQNLTFDSYEKVRDHVCMMGLDKLYQDRSANKYQDYIKQAGAYHIASQRQLI